MLEFGASMIIDRPVYGLLRRRSVTKWLMIVLVPNSSIIIRISELIVQNFAFILSRTVGQSVYLITFCIFFILDANDASTSPTSLFKVEPWSSSSMPKSSSVTSPSIRALDVFVMIESQIVDMDFRLFDLVRTYSFSSLSINSFMHSFRLDLESSPC